MKNLRIVGVLGAMGFGALGVQATPLTDLEAFFAERSSGWIAEWVSGSKRIAETRNYQGQEDNFYRAERFLRQLIQELNALLDLARAPGEERENTAAGRMVAETWKGLRELTAHPAWLPEASHSLEDQGFYDPKFQAFLAERACAWRVDFRKYIEEAKKSLSRLVRMEGTGLWGGLREIYAQYPFLEELGGNPPRISLPSGTFFGTEQEWWEKHRLELRRNLSHIKYFAERFSRELKALLKLAKTLQTSSEILPGQADGTARAEGQIQEAWRDLRSVLYGSPDELPFPGAGDLKEAKQCRKHEEFRWRQDVQREEKLQSQTPEIRMLTEEDLRQFLGRHGYADEESLLQLETDIRKILRKYSVE